MYSNVYRGNDAFTLLHSFSLSCFDFLFVQSFNLSLYAVQSRTLTVLHYFDLSLLYYVMVFIYVYRWYIVYRWFCVYADGREWAGERKRQMNRETKGMLARVV